MGSAHVYQALRPTQWCPRTGSHQGCGLLLKANYLSLFCLLAQRCPHPHPWNQQIWADVTRGLCRCDEVKDCEMGRLPWITQVGPLRSQGSWYVKEEGGVRARERRREGKSRGCRDAAVGRAHKPRGAGASGVWERPGSRLSPRASRMTAALPSLWF